MIDTQSTLGDLAAMGPEARGVLLRHQLDFCCGGRQTLSTACTRAGLEGERVAAEIEAATQAHPTQEGWEERPDDALIEHILTRFHAPLPQHLESVITAAARVERVHAAKPTCPLGLAALLREVQGELLEHLAKEEKVLFPAIRAGRRGAMLGSPVSVMLREHEEHGDNLKAIRALTDDLTPPPEACATWRTLYEELARLESDLMEHIHLENHILFPRALQEA